MDVQKLPKAALLHFSALCDLPETKKFSKKNSEFFPHFFPHVGSVEEKTEIRSQIIDRELLANLRLLF